MALLAIIVLASSLTSAISGPPLEMVDLTHVYDASTLHWPGDEAFNIKAVYNGTMKDFWYQTDKILESTHAGTHLDAPCHFAQGLWTIDEIPIERFVAPAAVIDITHKAEKDRDALVSVSDLEKWERRFRTTLHGHIVVIRTGWGSRWGDLEAYAGTKEQTGMNLHFPGISAEAATFLANERVINGVAIDTLSIDNGPSQEFMAHRILLGNSIFAMENVANVDKLPLTGATIYALPMKIGKASGAPVRILATFPKIRQ